VADNDWLAKEFRDEASSADVRATGTSGGHEQVRAVYQQAHEAWAKAHLRALHSVLLPSGQPPAVTLGLLDERGRPVQAGERATLDGAPALRLTVLVAWAGGPAAVLHHELGLAIVNYHRFPHDRDTYRPIVVGLHADLSRHVRNLPPPGRIVHAAQEERLRRARERMAGAPECPGTPAQLGRDGHSDVTGKRYRVAPRASRASTASPHGTLPFMDEPMSATEAARLIGATDQQVYRWIRTGLVEVCQPGGLGWREHRLNSDEVERLRVVAALVGYGLTTAALKGYPPETRSALHEAMRGVLEPTLLDRRP